MNPIHLSIVGTQMERLTCAIMLLIDMLTKDEEIIWHLFGTLLIWTLSKNIPTNSCKQKSRNWQLCTSI